MINHATNAFVGRIAAWDDLIRRLAKRHLLPVVPHSALVLGRETLPVAASYGRGALARCETFIVDLTSRLPFPDRTFRIVMCAHALGETSEPDAALADMARVLHPGGLLLILLGQGRTRATFPDGREIMRWMWESDVEPLDLITLGTRSQFGRMPGEAVIGRKPGRK